MEHADIQRAAQRVLAAILRTDEHGRPVHDEAAIRHFVPWMAIRMNVDFAALPAPTQRLVAEFIEGLGLDETATLDDLLAATDAFYAAHPLDPALERDVNHAMQGALTELSAAGAGEAAHRRMSPQAGGHVFRQALAG